MTSSLHAVPNLLNPRLCLCAAVLFQVPGLAAHVSCKSSEEGYITGQLPCPENMKTTWNGCGRVYNPHTPWLLLSLQNSPMQSFMPPSSSKIAVSHSMFLLEIRNGDLVYECGHLWTLKCHSTWHMSANEYLNFHIPPPTTSSSLQIFLLHIKNVILNALCPASVVFQNPHYSAIWLREDSSLQSTHFKV
jgi:hypothetical protein